MTAQKCHRMTGQPLVLCEAYVKHGLRLEEVTPQYAVDLRGLTVRENQALDAHYRTPLPVMGDCSPTCVMCHPELYDRSAADGIRR